MWSENGLIFECRNVNHHMIYIFHAIMTKGYQLRKVRQADKKLGTSYARPLGYFLAFTDRRQYSERLGLSS